MRKNNIGREWERKTAEFVAEKGMEILETNFTVKGGETDIIASDGEYICFIEIKYRKLGAIDDGISVGIKKQRRIIKSAEKYMINTGCRLQPRFDVVFVTSEEDGFNLEYIKNAFDSSGV